jgi:enamine deaminase RidA (YjgF/YER057c/UK114 family)
MKRAVVAILVAVLSLTMLSLLGGCGGEADKEEAQSLMKSGDNYMSEVQLATEELQAMQGDLTASAMGGDTAALTGEAGAAMQAQVEEILDSMEASLKAAQGEYEQILALDGVEDYKEYANTMLEAIDVYLEQLGYTRELIGMLVESLSAMAASGSFDLTALMGLMESEAYTKIEELGNQGDELVEEAEQIKLDKKLES